MDLFLLKKIITAFIMPINIVLLLLFAALIFYKKRAKISITCLSFATFLLFLSAIPIVSDTFMGKVEGDFETFSRSAQPVDYIIILGCTHTTNEALPATSQLKTCSLQRLVEAIRIFKLHPEAQLITSGFAGHDPVSNAEKVKEAAISLGIPENKILTEIYPKDTEEEAELIAPRVKGTNVVLVTNGDHMIRAIKYFQAQGVYPTPAPTGFWIKNPNAKSSWYDYVPNSEKLKQTSAAWYESLGLFVQWIKQLF